MSFNGLVYRIYDKNDWKQYKRYIRFKHKRLSKYKIRKYIGRRKAFTGYFFKIYRNKLIEKSTINYTLSKDGLALLLEPESKQLQSIPMYHRYIGYLLCTSKTKASDKLLITRWQLYKWLKNNNYKYN
jgi:hypothetical protein